MKKWFITFTHFFHVNKYTGRPLETLEKMNHCLINDGNDCSAVDHINIICSQHQDHKIYIHGKHGHFLFFSLQNPSLGSIEYCFALLINHFNHHKCLASAFFGKSYYDPIFNWGCAFGLQ